MTRKLGRGYVVVQVVLWCVGALAQTSIFNIQKSPSPNQQGNILNAVAALSTSDAWAVGYQNDNFINDSRTLTMHWNGTAWTVIPSPNPASIPQCQQTNTANFLKGVAMISANDVWAVGAAFDCIHYEDRPLALHWDGVQWTAVPTPQLLFTGNADFNAVVAFASNDVYAVGYRPAPNSEDLTLIEHWDGTSWKVVSSPNLKNKGNFLWGVSASGPNDIWAVGNSSSPTVELRTLALHFDGTKWSIVPTPNVVSGFLSKNVLTGVTAVSPTDVTAAGIIADANTLTQFSLIEHWDGTRWKVVPSANANSSLNTLNAITAISSNDQYAAGFFLDADGQFKTMIEHFDGATWNLVPSPTTGKAQVLNGIFAIPGTGNVWSVGDWSTVGIDPEDGFMQLPKTLVVFSPIG